MDTCLLNNVIIVEETTILIEFSNKIIKILFSITIATNCLQFVHKILTEYIFL